MSVRVMIVKGMFEMILVGVGVFLGMAADQWRTDRQHQATAIESLRRFKVEIENNRVSVANVKDYHVTMRADIIKHLDPKQRGGMKFHFNSIQPASFERTAWDLALSTQSLVEIYPEIAFQLTRVYGEQQTYASLTGGVLQAMYLRPPDADRIAFLQSVKVYYDDLVGLEPELMKMYATVLPMIDAALRD
jgi:hypothetical protein